MQDTR